MSLLRKLPILALARLFRKRIVVHVHASSPESLFDQIPPWAVQFALGSADQSNVCQPHRQRWEEQSSADLRLRCRRGRASADLLDFRCTRKTASVVEGARIDLPLTPIGDAGPGTQPGLSHCFFVSGGTT